MHSRAWDDRRRGFTLIELIVVIVLVGIVSAVAIASMGKSRQNRQRAAAHSLVVNIAYARERALATGHPTWVYVYTNTETITLYETVGGSLVTMTDPATNAQLATVLGASSDNAQFADVGIGTVNGATSASAIIFGFDWQGRLTDSGGTLIVSDWAVTITQTGQTTITLTIYAESGLAAVTAW